MAAIQKTVGALVGVEAVVASETTKQVDVTFDPGKVSVGQITEAMAEEGYPVKANTKTGVYWTPGSPLYDDASAEIWFASEELARVNGFVTDGEAR